MTALQTICLFATGYLTSRLMLAASLHHDLVRRLLRVARGRVSHVVLGVMLLAFLMSTVVPNALTVLALLPVIGRLRHLASQGPSPPGGERPASANEPALYGTILAMGLIYGANIGGVGSLLGSPANLYLLLTLRIYDVPGRESLQFVSWLLFGMPLALSLVFLLWGVLRLTAPSAMSVRLPEASGAHAASEATGTDVAGDATEASVGDDAREHSPVALRKRHLAVRFGLVWLLSWALVIGAGLVLGRLTSPLEAATATLASGTLLGQGWVITPLDVVALGLSLSYVAALFFWRLSTVDGPRPLFALGDLTRDLPWRGILVAVLVLGFLVLVAQSGVVGLLRERVPALLPHAAHPFLVSLVFVTVTIFATEILNNTTVSTVMFPLAALSAPAMGADPLTTMLGVSLASTCAFMTPVATPVNALALASLKGVSVGRFLFSGLWANLVAAVCISVWITWLVSPMLRLFGAS